ncbi:hypothetical protein [Aurantibacillus circumpalustris]|uniref:hypothetical protein n=1 Tax=Aurantibacillus circumpalustris TaxID=3036359 RepID=UPI00295AD740|nr:hypothetical protein [Aurantibacillus circumpalustris]
MKKVNFIKSKKEYQDARIKAINMGRNDIIKEQNALRNTLPAILKNAISFSPPTFIDHQTSFEVDIEVVKLMLQTLCEEHDLSDSQYLQDFADSKRDVPFFDLVQTDELSYNQIATYLVYHFHNAMTFQFEKVQGYIPLRQGLICNSKSGEEIRLALFFCFIANDDDTINCHISDLRNFNLVFKMDLYFYSVFGNMCEEWNRDNGFIA